MKTADEIKQIFDYEERAFYHGQLCAWGMKSMSFNDNPYDRRYDENRMSKPIEDREDAIEQAERLQWDRGFLASKNDVYVEQKPVRGRIKKTPHT